MTGPRQGVLGAPSLQHPVPPAWPARSLAPLGLRSGARPASAPNLEELRRKAGECDSGWLGRRRVRYCSFSDSEPLGWPEGAGEATPGLRLPAPGPSLAFPAAALRRAGRRDAGVRADLGQLGLREEGGCGAGRGAPASIDPNLCLGGWVPSLTHLPLRCRPGQVCACELVSAICRVHLSTPGSHCSLRLDLAPRFCGVGGRGRAGTCRGNRRAVGAQCKVESQVTSPGPGMHIQA